VKSRATSHEFILVDTPGQLECFLWSASGQIILHSFAAVFPTIVTYVTDLAVCKSPISFASNMMYGVTILYKSKLPMIIALNKVIIVHKKYGLHGVRFCALCFLILGGFGTWLGKDSFILDN